MPAVSLAAEVEALLSASALEQASTAVDKLLERPEALLDPSCEEAKSIAEEARCFVKLFFDAAQAHCPARVLRAADGLDSLVVEGFEPEQIWEELEVQNVPLRRHLRQSVKKLTSAPKGAVNFVSANDAEQPASSSKSAPAPEPRKGRDKKAALAALLKSQQKEVVEDDEDMAEEAGEEKDDEEAEKPTEEDEQLEDGFFSLEEMNRFADLAEAKGGMRLDEDAEDSDDFGLLEADEDENDEVSKEQSAGFADFFDQPSKSGSSREGKGKDSREARRAKAMEALMDEEEEEEDAELGGDAEDDELSDEERQLEAKLSALQAEGGESGDDEGDEEEDAASDATGLADSAADADEDLDRKLDGGEAEPKARKTTKSLYEMDKRLRGLEEEVNKLEEEQMTEKHWSLRGEVSAKHRPLNSLLEVHLDQPMTQLAGSRAGDGLDAAAAEGEGEEGALDDTPGGDSVPKQAGFDIDAIISQRVWDETYDDVVRRAELPPSQRPQGAEEDAVETLNFQKSRVGLGQVYEQQYQTEMMGHKTDAEQREDKDKTDTKALFAKLMYKLDLLTNAHFTPRPPALAADGKQIQKVASIKMEETIPLMMSDASLKAPEEVRAPRRHNKERDELTHEERKAARGAKKAGRRKGLEQRVESGELTLAGMRERNEKLQEKNKDAKLEKKNRGVAVDAKKRLRSTELLTQAAANAASGATRKDVAREERAKLARDGSTLSSKRLKL